MGKGESFPRNMREIKKYSGIEKKPQYVDMVKILERKCPYYRGKPSYPLMISCGIQAQSLCYHYRFLFFSQLFLFTKVALWAFRSDITLKPNSSHKSTISTLTRMPIISRKRQRTSYLKTISKPYSSSTTKPHREKLRNQVPPSLNNAQTWL